MPKATFFTAGGSRTIVDVEIGCTLMRAASLHDVKGLVGDCGGNLTCATCHVFVDDPFAQRLPSPSEVELQMLDYTAAPRQANSRLCCQIVMTKEIDGLTIVIADPQL